MKNKQGTRGRLGRRNSDRFPKSGSIVWEDFVLCHTDEPLGWVGIMKLSYFGSRKNSIVSLDINVLENEVEIKQQFGRKQHYQKKSNLQAEKQFASLDTENKLSLQISLSLINQNVIWPGKKNTPYVFYRLSRWIYHPLTF